MREVYKDEIRDRIRRIETKLSRFIAGESDRPTNYTAEEHGTPETGGRLR